MKHLTRLKEIEGGSIVSFAFEFTEGELVGAYNISDTKYASLKQLMDSFDEDPGSALALIRDFLFMVDVWNSKGEPGSAKVIELMTKRGNREPTRRRSKGKAKARVRRKLSKRS